MSDLAEFLAARLDEDEAAAKAWPDIRPQTSLHDQLTIHGPMRVLREVEAKRAILAEHAPDEWGDCSRCAGASEPYEPPAAVRWPCPTVRALAAVYQTPYSTEITPP